MKKYWISFWTGNYKDEGCTKPPFQFWASGTRSRLNEGLSDEQYEVYIRLDTEEKMDEYLDEFSKDDCSVCALVLADTTEEIWDAVAKYFPDYEIRFCEEREDDFTPGDRFLDFENKLSLV